ncbi:CheR family methyltransferase [Lichenicola sp.]|uniref:CheR family methyltransferase n=1 Tax=Lichenicola sp. TaxID=2804529 RepID=UPI003B00C525
MPADPQSPGLIADRVAPMTGDADHAVFARIKAMVIGRTLHHYYQDKDALLRERLARRMQQTGLDAAGYLARLEARDGAAAAEAEWLALEAEITVGETFFFRYPEQFAALEERILPELIRARSATRRLRIWSAGCASGAEPYSIAILLHRLLGSALPDWSVSILGTDLSATALQAAQAAEYGDWALRTMPDADRQRDFIAVAGGRRWQLRPAFRGMVRFERHNLLRLLDTDLPLQFSDYDLVLCRNVLIYFHADQVRALVQRFAGLLASDGWLLLGHAEAGTGVFEGLRPVPMAGTLAWQREIASPHGVPARPEVSGQHVPAAKEPPQPVARADRPAARRRIPVVAQEAPAPIGTVVVEPPGGPVHERIRAMADAGQHADALAACREELRRRPAAPSLLFYAALLARALGRELEAEADFRRAISLCNDFAMAHYHLGLLLMDAGRIEPGRRAIAEAGRIARDLAPDTILDDGDGMTAGRLRVLSRLDWAAAPASARSDAGPGTA